MTRRLVRATLLAFIGLAVVAAVWPSLIRIETESSPTPKAETFLGSCAENNKSGITLVVEYDTEVYSGCVTGSNLTGWDILNQLGARPQGTEQYPAGFVCKLFGYPDSQDCKNTPVVAEGTWNYFYATHSEGNHWIYTPTGSSIRKPKCGDFEGWVFEVPESSQSAAALKTNPEPFSCE